MGRTAISVQADLLIEADAKSLVARAAQQLGGPILCLVNNASKLSTTRLKLHHGILGIKTSIATCAPHSF
jgi:NAD(P)-dependent dehydrogenase (short-subunit alcohol dehydrogenase family)